RRGRAGSWAPRGGRAARSTSGRTPGSRSRSSFYSISLQRLQDPIGLEPLADQVPEQARELAVVGDRLAPAQPCPQRRLQQHVVVDRLEDLVDRRLGRLLGDTRALDLQADADLAALADA